MNNKKTYEVEVSSFRNQYESPDGRKISAFVIPVENLPAEWEDWREVNVRDSNVRGEVYTAIKDTLTEHPQEMIFRNLGLTILASEVEFDNKTNCVRITFVDKHVHGIANGGHTFTAIQEVVQEFRSQGAHVDASVKVECIVGVSDNDTIVSIVDGRNRARAVKTHSLENLSHSYDSLKRVLKNPYYRDRISYSEYERDAEGKKRDISIREILSYIYCLDASFDRNIHPIQAYSSKGAVVDYFAAEDQSGGQRVAVLEKASGILPDILRLRDVIYRDLPEAYNKIDGRFGALETMGVLKYTNPRPLRFLEDETKYHYPDGFIYPVLASFRQIIDHSGTEWSWKENPFEVWDNKKHDVASAIKDAVNFSQNANKMGKTSATWRMCYDALAG